MCKLTGSHEEWYGPQFLQTPYAGSNQFGESNEKADRKKTQETFARSASEMNPCANLWNVQHSAHNGRELLIYVDRQGPDRLSRDDKVSAGNRKAFANVSESAFKGVEGAWCHTSGSSDHASSAGDENGSAVAW